MICPKCGKEILGKAHFSEPDHKGIIAMVWHSEIEVTSIFGEKGKRIEDRCFLTEEEWKKMIGR